LWTTLEGEHCFTVLAFADPDADRSLCGKPVAVTFCPDDEQSDRDDDGDDNPWHDWSIILPRGCWPAAPALTLPSPGVPGEGKKTLTSAFSSAAVGGGFFSSLLWGPRDQSSF